jgi:signal transduction histidine kinase
LWRGLLIVLPALVMALFGFVSLRQDRLLVRHQAAEEAAALATHLVESYLPSALTMGLGQPPAFDFEAPTPPFHDPVLLAAQHEIVAVLSDVRGVMIYPPPLRWPSPEPLVLSELAEELRPAWTKACRGLWSGDDPTTAATAFDELLAKGLPERFESLARLHLLGLSLRSGWLDAAQRHFQEIQHRPSAIRSEAGVPLRLWAEWRWLQSGFQAADTGAYAQVDWLGAYAIQQPGPLSQAILDGIRQFLNRGGSAPTVPSWVQVWRTHQEARKFAEFLEQRHAAETTNANFAEWIQFEESPHLLLQEQIDTGRWWLAWPWTVVSNSVSRALATLPRHLSCSATIAGRPVSPRSPLNHTFLAADRASGEGSLATVDLTATICLADPDALYARQRKRTWWFGSLIAVSAASVLCGVLAAWRGFREQQRLTEMKSNFVSSVSHEMRAPIASVRLMAEELVDRGSADPAKAGEYHGYILQECRRLSALIENVLDFSRHEQGRKQYQFEPTDLVRVVEATLQVMRSYAADRQVRLERRLEGVPFELDVDSAAIQQVLVNLLDNAIKHSPPGATVEVALAYPETAVEPLANRHPRTSPHTPPLVRLSVRDQGPGIPEDEQRLIFQRFYRRGTELRRETPGIGLGLAIVHYIAEAHGGSVQVESQVGKGSRFIVELPLTERPRT